MSDINIPAILAKHSGYTEEELLDTSRVMMGQAEVFAAFKEAMEAVVDKCKEEATAIEGYNTGFSGSAASVDKQSIDNLKTMVKYE